MGIVLTIHTRRDGDDTEIANALKRAVARFRSSKEKNVKKIRRQLYVFTDGIKSQLKARLKTESPYQ